MTRRAVQLFRTGLRVIGLMTFGGSRYRVRGYVYAMAAAQRWGWRSIGWLLESRLQRRYGVFLSRKATFDSTLRLKHPVGIVVGEGVKLGRNVTLYQGVTLGGARVGDAGGENYPVLGDGCVVFAGAVVLGGVTLGDHCTVGANSVVRSSMPANSVVVGVPARALESRKA